jgi:hypothetical protein
MKSGTLTPRPSLPTNGVGNVAVPFHLGTHCSRRIVWPCGTYSNYCSDSHSGDYIYACLRESAWSSLWTRLLLQSRFATLCPVSRSQPLLRAERIGNTAPANDAPVEGSIMSYSSTLIARRSVSIITAGSPSEIKRRPVKLVRRLFLSLPLMTLAGFCLFGFVGTFEAMPRVEQWTWRAVYLCAGAASLGAICWIWLKPRSHRPA